MATPAGNLYEASQGQLMWRRFRKHRVAYWCLLLVVALYALCLACPWVAPYDPARIFQDHVGQPPQPLRVGWVPGYRLPRVYVHPWRLQQDAVTLARKYELDRTTRVPLLLLVRADGGWRLFGTPAGTPAFLLGTNKLGQDVLSRVLYGGRISLLLGLTGVLLTFVFGIALGGISGYYGGTIDMIIQRAAEMLQSVPKIPIWLALAAAIPKSWTSLQVYFGMTVILGCIGWTGLAVTVRGKLLSLRQEDYARAALLVGASELRTIFVHLMPNFLSHIIASLTLAVPGMILAETALSFLGLGMQPPMVSWGVLLQETRNPGVILDQPWLLLPAVAVILAVVAMNFVGEGLRDAADPYS